MFLSESEFPESNSSSVGSSPTGDSESQHSESLDPQAELPMAARIINSKSLFGEARIIHIEHRGMIYRMSITNQNRLILQK